MRRQPIPKKDELAHAGLLHELFQEADQFLVVVVASDNAEEETTAFPVPPVCDHGADRELLPVERMNNDRGLSSRSPGPSYRRLLRDATFIEEYYPCAPDFGVFFTSAQVRLFQ